jgi:hypothetical protein
MDHLDGFAPEDFVEGGGELAVAVVDQEPGYRRERFVRETWISASAKEAKATEDGLRFRIRVEPQGEWMTCLDVAATRHAFADVTPTVKYDHGDTDARPNMGYTLEEWLESAPKLETDCPTLAGAGAHDE